jgi:hypothetical protein
MLLSNQSTVFQKCGKAEISVMKNPLLKILCRRQKAGGLVRIKIYI